MPTNLDRNDSPFLSKRVIHQGHDRRVQRNVFTHFRRILRSFSCLGRDACSFTTVSMIRESFSKEKTTSPATSWVSGALITPSESPASRPV
mgnify:CR=1 FL=1